MIELKPFQIEGATFLVVRKRCILADEMGAGKTPQTVRAWRELKPSRTLIRCSRNAFRTWRRHFKEMLDIDIELIHSSKATRETSWRYAEAHSGVYMTTYATAAQDLKNGIIPTQWDCIIDDEANKIPGRKTDTWKRLKQIKGDVHWMVTGTPAKKGPQDLWRLLNILYPTVFRSYWKFVEEYCYVVRGAFGFEIHGVRNVVGLREMLKGYMIRRLKKDVAPELPPKIRDQIPVEMSSEVKRVYDNIQTDMLSFTDSGELVVASGVLAKLTRCRQLLVCPAIIDPALGVGAGIEAIVEKTKDEEDDARHFVIYSPYKGAFPYFKEYLHENGFESVGILQGGMSSNAIDEVIDEFNREKGVILCSIQFAASFDLDSSSYAYFCGCEWNPDDNEQAEDRQHRMTTVNPLNVYYMVHENTVEDIIVWPVVNEKHQDLSRFMRTTNGLKAILSGDLKKLVD